MIFRRLMAVLLVMGLAFNSALAIPPEQGGSGAGRSSHTLSGECSRQAIPAFLEFFRRPVERVPSHWRMIGIVAAFVLVHSVANAQVPEGAQGNFGASTAQAVMDAQLTILSGIAVVSLAVAAFFFVGTSEGRQRIRRSAPKTILTLLLAGSLLIPTHWKIERDHAHLRSEIETLLALPSAEFDVQIRQLLIRQVETPNRMPPSGEQAETHDLEFLVRMLEKTPSGRKALATWIASGAEAVIKPLRASMAGATGPATPRVKGIPLRTNPGGTLVSVGVVTMRINDRIPEKEIQGQASVLIHEMTHVRQSHAYWVNSQGFPGKIINILRTTLYSLAAWKDIIPNEKEAFAESERFTKEAHYSLEKEAYENVHLMYEAQTNLRACVSILWGWGLWRLLFESVGLLIAGVKIRRQAVMQSLLAVATVGVMFRFIESRLTSEWLANILVLGAFGIGLLARAISLFTDKWSDRLHQLFLHVFSLGLLALSVTVAFYMTRLADMELATPELLTNEFHLLAAFIVLGIVVQVVRPALTHSWWRRFALPSAA